MGLNVTLSPQSLVSCPNSKGACKGGTDTNALHYMAEYGLQSCTNACTSGCEPYGSGHIPKTCKNDTNKDHCHGCDKQCHDGTKATLYKVDPDSIVKGKLDGPDEENVKNQIMTHGSVTGGLSVYNNWHGWVKKHGPDVVYDSHENSTHEGGHCIKIIGWGVSLGKKYWLVQNSWGAGFGDAGTIKMLRGESTTKSGGDRCIWNSADYAMPVKPTSTPDWATPVKPTRATAASFPAHDTNDLSATAGAWGERDHTHPFWREQAQHVFALTNVVGDFGTLDRVESQVTAGFNARFTITSKAGLRAVISSSQGMEQQLLSAPIVESVVAV